MDRSDPTPFRNSGAYDEQTGLLVDISMKSAQSGNFEVLMTKDVDSIGAHSSKPEDIFDCLRDNDLTFTMDSIINKETFVTKSPITIKCAPSSLPGFHPTYRNRNQQTLPAKYFPNIRFGVVVKRNIPFFISLYVLRSVEFHGTRVDSNEIALISCCWNTVRQLYQKLASWKNIPEERKVCLVDAFNSWAPFLVKSGKSEEQKHLSNRPNGCCGKEASYLPTLFMDAMRNIAGNGWHRDYTHFLNHRNQSPTLQLSRADWRDEAQCMLRDMFFSVQAVGFKSKWLTVENALCKERGMNAPQHSEAVSTEDIPNLCRLMNLRMAEARKFAIQAFFKPIKEIDKPRHFFHVDVGISFSPMKRNRSFVFDGFAVSNLVKKQMKVKVGERYDEDDEYHAILSDRRPSFDDAPYDATDYPWIPSEEQYEAPESSSEDEDSIIPSQTRTRDKRTEDGTNSKTPQTSRMRGGADEPIVDHLGELLALLDAELVENDIYDLEQDLGDNGVDDLEVEEDGKETEQVDLLDIVEDLQRPLRVQYPLFGTRGEMGNAQQVKNLVEPKFEQDSGYSGLIEKHYVRPYIPSTGATITTGMKTYLDVSRTMFQRWTHSHILGKLKYLGIRVAQYLKGVSQSTDGAKMVPPELQNMISNVDRIFDSFLNDFRRQDRCKVRCEYTYMGTGEELMKDFDTIVRDDLCPLLAVKEVVHSELYWASHAFKQQNVRPLMRLCELNDEKIHSIYTPDMKTCVVKCAEASVQFLQCGGLVQGSIHAGVMTECDTLFLQVPSTYHTILDANRQSTSLLAYGIQPKLLPLLSDQFMRDYPRSCLCRMDATQIAAVSRNASDLIQCRDQLFQTLFASVPELSLNTVGCMSVVPFDLIVEQDERVLNGIVEDTARLIYRIYSYEWRTIVKPKHRGFMMDLNYKSVEAMAEETNGYVYNTGNTRYTRGEPTQTVDKEIHCADRLLELMAGRNAQELSKTININFQGSGVAWEKHRKKQGWNKSPTTLFVALVYSCFAKLEEAMPFNRLENMEVNPFSTRNLAAYLGLYYIRGGTPTNPPVVFYTHQTRQRRFRIAVPVFIVPIFGSMLNRTLTKVSDPLPKLLTERNRGIDNFMTLFCYAQEAFPVANGGGNHPSSRVNVVDIMIQRMAWQKVVELAHANNTSDLILPRGFPTSVGTTILGMHTDQLWMFFDDKSRFVQKWKNSVSKRGVHIEKILLLSLEAWGIANHFSPSFCVLMFKAVDKKHWEEYRSMLAACEIEENGSKVDPPIIEVLNPGIMGGRLNHVERMEEFGKTGMITTDLFSGLVAVRHEWVKLRNAYYNTEIIAEMEGYAEQMVLLIRNHSAVAGVWNLRRLKGILEKPSGKIR